MAKNLKYFLFISLFISFIFLLKLKMLSIISLMKQTTNTKNCEKKRLQMLRQMKIYQKFLLLESNLNG